MYIFWIHIIKKDNVINPENHPTEIKQFSYRTKVSPKEELVLPPNLVFSSSNENEDRRQKFFDFSFKSKS